MHRIFLAVCCALAVACGSGDDSRDAGSDATKGSDVTPDVIVDPSNCVAPTTPNDDRGVGGYCSPGGGQCAASGPAGAPRICTADLSGAEAHAWYCTYPCSLPSDCGSTASCIATPQGKMCVPPSCAPIDDAGVDGADAAPSDASDATTTDAPTD